MDRQELYRYIALKMEQRRDECAAEHEARVSECYSKCPRLSAIDSELTELAIKAGRAALSGGPDSQAAFARADALNREREELLAGIGKSSDYLEDVFVCRICNDTGIHDGKLCECAEKLAASKRSEQINSRSPMSLCSFSSFSLDYYSDETDPRYETSPREHMGYVLNSMKDYARDFSRESKSLLLLGAPGLGKTHLALAVGNELIKHGFDVAYIPSHTLFLQLEKERFAREDDSDTAEAAISCDLFILDDLGTEFSSAFTQMQLYNIINTRLLDRRPTIISTNLDLSELREKYPPRIVSRLMGEYSDLLFIGKDVRIAKKYKD